MVFAHAIQQEEALPELGVHHLRGVPDHLQAAAPRRALGAKLATITCPPGLTTHRVWAT